MFLPTNSQLTYSMLVNEIEKGVIKIPQFQREFVWSKKDSSRLLDSIIKGYPIGTFILWKTKNRLRSIRNIGKVKLPDTLDEELVSYVLDGQQRITSIYIAIKGLELENQDKKSIDYSDIYVDLEATEEEEIVTIDVSNKIPGEYIKLTELLNGGLNLAEKFEKKYWDKIVKYAEKFKTYSFSIITINEAPIEVATEVFTRINVGGKTLTVFEIMVAKTYDDKKEFDLSEKYDDLIERLGNANYNTIPSSTVLQSIAVCMSKDCSKKNILKLNKDEFIAIWDDVIKAIEATVDYFRHFYRIPVSQLLPYDGLIVPFTYFFYYHKDKPLGKKQKYLQDYFWRTVLNSRFSNSLETKVTQDIKRIDSILKEELPDYEDGVDISVASLSRNGWFSTGTSYIKGLLCILAYQQPKSFKDNAIVNINNDWLKQANSKNYHHFFPKAYLAKRKEEEFFVNHIANIVIVDDFLNKRIIKDKAPSKYMKEFIKNIELNSTMKTHLIGDLEEWGICNDNYDLFFEKRLEEFSKELQKRLVLKEKFDIL